MCSNLGEELAFLSLLVRKRNPQTSIVGRYAAATEQEARQGQNLRGDLLILNKIIFLIPFLCARLTNCNDFEQVFVYDCPLSSKYNCKCPAKLRVPTQSYLASGFENQYMLGKLVRK